MDEALPAALGGRKAVEHPPPHYTWPIISNRTREAVARQLDEAVTIYDRSGVFERFERKFAAYHGVAHALLHNSGTCALLAAFYALGLKPGDEVLCPAYTFFATVSPLMILGATPVFCDCDRDGNIAPESLAERITQRTKAVVVTHMWGMPCEMDPITEFCRAKGLPLVEDCSHAHGARYRERLVGTFGDVAVWSLQGQKLVTGGEGGILLTADSEIFYRALLLGQYCSRARQEIPAAHPLSRFWMTGAGLKLRAHPLAIAMAEEQLESLDLWLRQKRAFAGRLRELLRDVAWLRLPCARDRDPSWYAFVMQYSAPGAGGPGIDEVFALLEAEGLAELERPAVTGAVDQLPLFRDPGDVFPWFESAGKLAAQDCPRAAELTANALKLPVWVREEDGVLLESYARGIRKIAHWLRGTRSHAARSQGSFFKSTKPDDTGPLPPAVSPGPRPSPADPHGGTGAGRGPGHRSDTRTWSG
jgi:dTDP-4-amino-4,6-dideoxygalactose transaminase